MEKLEQTLSLLQQMQEEFGEDVVFACSFGAEDVTLLDIIATHNIHVRVISLDTGRLPKETYDVMAECCKKYPVKLEIYFPDAADVEEMVRKDCINLFYDSVEKRKKCCYVRKVLPLKRALKGAKAWMTGVRRDQADSRAEMGFVEDDKAFGIKKYNPLLEWTEADVWDYIRANDVPYNKLHDQFYPSIGCAPCTRAIAVGEDPRAGRWWWEQEDAVAECGMHASPLKKPEAKGE